MPFTFGTHCMATYGYILYKISYIYIMRLSIPKYGGKEKINLLLLQNISSDSYKFGCDFLLISVIMPFS